MSTIILLFSIPLVAYLLWYCFGIVLSFFARNKKENLAKKHYSGKVAFLYLTCNDFSTSACSTLFKQKGIEFDLFVLDDSTKRKERDRIDQWIKAQGVRINVIRRFDRNGFKAGNINHWLDKYGDPITYPYILIVDSDEHLPDIFTQNLLKYFNNSNYTFVQGCHIGTANIHTFFQKILHPQVECDWLHQVPARNLIGIPPMLGHGVLIKTKDLISVGGFPNLVSEDLALTICLTKAGFKGVIASDVIAYEEFPPSFISYWVRRKRMIEADIQIVKNMLKMIFESRVSLTSKIDLVAREIRLSVSSLFWLILFFISISSIFQIKKIVIVPSVCWIVLPIILITFLPALFITRINFLQRSFYICAASFICAAICTLSLIHSFKGFFYQCEFEPTGNKYREFEIISPSLFWELFSSLTFILGGIVSQNYSLIAIGLAVGCSPIMRTRLYNSIFILGVFGFWVLIVCQISIDIANGSFPIEHLIVLLGISDANWG